MTATSSALRVVQPTRAARLLDVEVKVVHSRRSSNKEFVKWPGIHANVHVWWGLANGKAVAWNEGPRGWSFPVISLGRTATAKLHIWDGPGDERQLNGHLYVCAASREKAITLLKRSGHLRITFNQLDHDFNKDCRGNLIGGVKLERGVWIVHKAGDKPEKLI